MGFHLGNKFPRIPARLLKKIADSGTDCALVHMPFNLAVFGMNRAEKVTKEYD